MNAGSTRREADAVEYLSALPDGSLGGIFAAQVVEHLQPATTSLAMIELAFHKLRPGDRIVLETINPACWVAFFESYIRDITHVWPLHPETLQYPDAGGWVQPCGHRLSLAGPGGQAPAGQPPREGAGATLDQLIGAFNRNVERLNRGCSPSSITPRSAAAPEPAQFSNTQSPTASPSSRSSCEPCP